MKQSLQNKVDLLSQNSKIVRKSAKLDFEQAANLGALLFTAQNRVASEAEIRANRKILKQNTGIMNNMRGPAANLAILSRMCLQPDPEAYLRSVIDAYDSVKASKLYKSEALVFTAMSLVENTDPAEYDQASQAAWATLGKMRAAHPLLTSQDDLTLAHLLNISGIDIDEMLMEAELIYKTLKPTGFKLKKDTLQSVSIILALSDKPVQEKCARFTELREALKNAGQRIYGLELSIVAAFVDIDKPTDEVVQDVSDLAAALKHVRGFGIMSGGNLRRMYSCAIALQVYGEEMSAAGNKAASAVTETVVSEVIFQIIMIIIMTAVITSSMQSSSAS